MQIRIKGGQGPKPFFDVSYTTPWPELLQTPGGDVLDQLRAAKNLTVPGGGNLAGIVRPRPRPRAPPRALSAGGADYWDSPEYPFRVWKSHFTPRSATNQHPQAVLPVRERPRVKFVAMARPVLDVLRLAPRAAPVRPLLWAVEFEAPGASRAAGLDLQCVGPAHWTPLGGSRTGTASRW